MNDRLHSIKLVKSKRKEATRRKIDSGVRLGCSSVPLPSQAGISEKKDKQIIRLK